MTTCPNCCGGDGSPSPYSKKVVPNMVTHVPIEHEGGEALHCFFAESRRAVKRRAGVAENNEVRTEH